MKQVRINNKDYEVIKDYKNGFDQTELENKITDYFDEYDYILGDWSYGKLRLKGFCDKTNKNFKSINDFENIEDYIKDNCAYECSYVILKLINNI